MQRKNKRKWLIKAREKQTITKGQFIGVMINDTEDENESHTLSESSTTRPESDYSSEECLFSESV